LFNLLSLLNLLYLLGSPLFLTHTFRGLLVGFPTGKGLGFEITRILQVAHGGNRNDTIVTVDRKMKNE
jgi:hypothetical protein